MRARIRRFYFTLVSCCFSLAPLSAYTTVPNQPVDLYSFDLLNADLAKRVKDKILGANSDANADFVVGLTSTADPIGTLYRPGTRRVISRSACVDVIPATVDAYYFPTKYTLTREAAVALGLDSALTKIAELGINLSNDRGISLEFSQNTQSEVDDKQINNIITLNQVCKSTIGGNEVDFVRGYVSLKRSFTASASTKFDINIKAQKIGTLTIKPVAASREVKIVDDIPANFIQIIQIVKVGLTGLTGVTRPADAAEDTGLIYIQVDASDTSGTAEQLEKALRSANLRFSGGIEIEKVETTEMPPAAQVRYFNDRDKGKAETILEIVRKFKPNAISVRVGLPAAMGETEIWLPR